MQSRRVWSRTTHCSSWYAVGVACASAIAVVGCHSSVPTSTVDPQVVADYRARLALAEEPAGAMAVLDVREIFIGPTDEPPADHATVQELSEEQGEVEFAVEEEGPAKVSRDDSGQSIASMPPQDVVAVGQIGGMPNPWKDSEPDFPFKQGSATMFVVDPGTAAQFAATAHDHADGVDCPFCARHASENVTSVAVVNFMDEAGQVVDIRADELLDLNAGDTVVVHGQARMVGGEMLVINADGIYVRR